MIPYSWHIVLQKTINQGFGLLTIRRGTFCNNGLDQHTMRICGQMYLGVELPFVFAIS